MNDLCSWVDSFFMELINTSQAPDAEAWLLVASCIRKFCEVLGGPCYHSTCVQNTCYNLGVRQADGDVQVVR